MLYKNYAATIDEGSSFLALNKRIFLCSQFLCAGNSSVGIADLRNCPKYVSTPLEEKDIIKATLNKDRKLLVTYIR